MRSVRHVNRWENRRLNYFIAKAKSDRLKGDFEVFMV